MTTENSIKPIDGKGIIAKILKHSSVDGPGNRAVVFLQGCDFDCVYCHNPETRALCNHCAICVPACKYSALKYSEEKVFWSSKNCVDCGACIAACPYGSSPKTRRMSAEEVLEEIAPYKGFLSGITISGGECGLQTSFLEFLIKRAADEGLPCMVDTNGSTDYSLHPELLNAGEGFMLDVKAWSKEDHLRLCSFDNTNVIKNLHTLASAKKLYEVRTVISPGLFNMEETIVNVAMLVSKYSKINKKNIRYKLITYRPNGVRQSFAKKLGIPGKELMFSLAELAKARGVEELIIV